MEIDIATGASVLTVKNEKHGAAHRFLLDVADWPRVSQHRWRLDVDQTPKTGGATGGMRLSHFITGSAKGKHHRFLNGNKADFRRANLHVYDVNKYVQTAEGRFVLTIDSGHGKFDVLVDADDVPRLKTINWHILQIEDDRVYFHGTNRGKNVRLHRFIMNAPRGMEVDFICPGKTLDCRKSNLRFADNCRQSQNSRKRRFNNYGKPAASKYIGVDYAFGGWRARIQAFKKRVVLGVFPFTPQGEIAAARAYNDAAIRYHGAYAEINVIEAA